MDSQYCGQRDVSSSSSSGSSEQSFKTQPPEPPISVTNFSYIDNDRDDTDPATNTSGEETGTRFYTALERSLSSPSPRTSPSPPATSSHNWHPTTNPGLSNNHRYHLTSSEQSETETIYFSYPHDNNDSDGEYSCLCLLRILIRAVLNLANGIRSITMKVIAYLRTGADWVPPIPPASESDSDSGGGLDQRGKRRRRQKRKGPPPPIFVPVLPSFRDRHPAGEDKAWRYEQGREGDVPLRVLGNGVAAIGERLAATSRNMQVEGERSDHDALDREGRKKWKGKKAVEAEERSRVVLGRNEGDPGKLRRGTYVPVQPDRRGTVWQP